MNDPRAIDILNRLLEAEYGNLIQRLGEAGAFVTWRSAGDKLLVDRMLADHRRHERDLAQAILALRGSPISPTYPTAMGGVHYLKLDFLMPQVIESVENLVRLYETTGTTGHREADVVINRNLADHRRHLAELRKLHGGYRAAG